LNTSPDQKFIKISKRALRFEYSNFKKLKNLKIVCAMIR